jgi:hypothetical protein
MPDRISFVDALRWLVAAGTGLLLRRIRVLPLRPDRHEQRVRKRRPKNYPLMTKPRAELMQALSDQSLNFVPFVAGTFSPRPKGGASRRRTAAASRGVRRGREPRKWQVASQGAALWWMPIHPNWSTADGGHQPRGALLTHVEGSLSSPLFTHGFCRGAPI